MSKASSRRTFLKSASTVAAASTLLAPHVYANDDPILKIGIVGCGSRGTGAAVNAIRADKNTQLWSMGELFDDRLKMSQEILIDEAGDQYQVTEDRCFVGFDAYQSVIDSGVDVVILATPPHFRPQHFEAVVEAGKHCFIEKPIAVDVPGVQRVKAAAEKAKSKNLAVVSGLCWRYDDGVVETIRRIHDGAIGDIVSIQSTYNTGTLWHRGNKPDWSKMEFQLRNWLYYTWLSGDHIVEQAIHSLDKTAWLNHDASPVSVYGVGGRQQRTGKEFGNIYDHHSLTFEYPSGVMVYFMCRQQANCSNLVDEYVLGTKGKAWVVKNRIMGDTHWQYEQKGPSMYDREHQRLFASIRAGEPINNGDYMCNSTLIAIAGRFASYTGQELSWDKVNQSTQVLGPQQYAWTDVPEPPVAIPGVTEFA